MLDKEYLTNQNKKEVKKNEQKRKLSVLITLVSILTILSGILSLKIFNQINTSSNAKDGIVVENTSNSKETVTTTKDKSAEITTKNYLIKTVYFDERKQQFSKMRKDQN